MLSLQCLWYPFVLRAKLVLVQLFAMTEDIRTICYTVLLLSSLTLPSQYTLLAECCQG